MPHEVIASLSVPLPDDPQAMAEALSFIAKTWAAMLGEMGNTDAGWGPLKPQAQLHVNEVRTKAKTKPATNSGQGTVTRTRTITAQPEAPDADAAP